MRAGNAYASPCTAGAATDDSDVSKLQLIPFRVASVPMQRKLTGLLRCPRCCAREVLVWTSIADSALVDSAYQDGYLCNSCGRSSDTDDRWWCRKCNWDTCALPEELSSVS